MLLCMSVSHFKAKREYYTEACFLTVVPWRIHRHDLWTCFRKMSQVSRLIILEAKLIPYTFFSYIIHFNLISMQEFRKKIKNKVAVLDFYQILKRGRPSFSQSTWVLSSCQRSCFLFPGVRAAVPIQLQDSHRATCCVLVTPPEVQPGGMWWVKIRGTIGSISWCLLQSRACHPQQGHTDSPTVLKENFKSNSMLLFSSKLRVKFPLTSAGGQFTLNASNTNQNVQNTDIIKQKNIFKPFFFFSSLASSVTYSFADMAACGF